jgi:hypothetical protein
MKKLVQNYYLYFELAAFTNKILLIFRIFMWMPQLLIFQFHFLNHSVRKFNYITLRKSGLLSLNHLL